MTSCNLCGTQVDPEASLVWQKDGFAIVRCPSCDLVFRADLPEAEELAEIYAPSYFRNETGEEDRQGYADYFADADHHRLNARRRLSLLRRRGATGGTLLDVGCAAGFFVAEARAQGWTAEGVDIAAEVVEWGRAHVGAPLSVGTIEHVPKRGDLDVVTMWDYIEHSLDPTADVRAASALLRPGGIVALSTGDVSSVVARLSGKRWHLLTPRHHNYYFSRATLTRLLESQGFEIVSIGAPSNSYSVGHLLYKLQTLAPGRGFRSAAARARGTRLGTFAIPVNLWDIVTVVARKTRASVAA